jgi:ABC-type spermidine/putrescine transport system permease subunit II
MTHRISRGLGIVAITASIVALCAQGYAVALPYRISPLQESILSVSFLVEMIALAVAFLTGVTTMYISRHQSTTDYRLGLIAVLLAVVVLVVGFCTNNVHSTTHRFDSGNAPNKSLQATRDGGSSSASRFRRFGPACLSSGRWVHV